MPDEDLTEFSLAWKEFEQQLAQFLARLADPAAHGSIRINAPAPVGEVRRVTIIGTYREGNSGVIVTPRGSRLGHREFYELTLDRTRIAEVAGTISAMFRDQWQIAHPSLLCFEADSTVGAMADALGIGAVNHVPNELTERQPEGDAHAGVFTRGDKTNSAGNDDHPVFDPRHAVWPDSATELRSAVEEVLTLKYGYVDPDEDGDYVVNRLSILGTRFYVTVFEDRPVIKLWKTIVREVHSKRAAVIEANYLNRIHPFTRWVLWGNDLHQEMYLATAPFVPFRFDELLHLFTEQYEDNKSALQLRLGRDT